MVPGRPGPGKGPRTRLVPWSGSGPSCPCWRGGQEPASCPGPGADLGHHHDSHAPRRLATRPGARPALYLGRGQEVMRGPGGGGRAVLSQSEDQSRVHTVFIFVLPMSTQVRSLGLDTDESAPRSDPQIATRTQKRSSKQAAGYPTRRIRLPGSMPREHDRRPTVRANVTKGQGISVLQSVSPRSCANYRSANGTEPRHKGRGAP